jgi:hypothetical protein
MDRWSLLSLDRLSSNQLTMTQELKTLGQVTDCDPQRATRRCDWGARKFLTAAARLAYLPILVAEPLRIALSRYRVRE